MSYASQRQVMYAKLVFPGLISQITEHHTAKWKYHMGNGLITYGPMDSTWCYRGCSTTRSSLQKIKSQATTVTMLTGLQASLRPIKITAEFEDELGAIERRHMPQAEMGIVINTRRCLSGGSDDDLAASDISAPI